MASASGLSAKEYAKELENNMKTHDAYDNPEYKWDKKDFELGVALGKGKFGRVYVAREIKTHFLVAMKVLFKSEIMKSGIERKVMHEIEIQSHLKHPNILRLYTWFHDDKRIYLALELAAHGELYTHLQKSPNHRFDEPRSARYIYQVADALNFCHLHKVIHRDLKPENLLLADDDQIKLSDFGWSVHSASKTRKTMCGTLDYLPPEMVKGNAYDDSVDQWCLGILCYEFLVGKPPFETGTKEKTYYKILRTKIDYPTHVSVGARDLISNLVKKENRISLDEVMKHSWISLKR